MRRARWIAFIVGTSALALAEVGCADWFGNDLTPYTPADAAKPNNGDAHPEAAAETGGGNEGGGNEASADTGADTNPPRDAGKDTAEKDAADAAVEDADAGD